MSTEILQQPTRTNEAERIAGFAPLTGSAITTGTWVVCLNMLLHPSTWGFVHWCNGTSTHVRYGKGAPIWESNVWKTEYLKPCASEEEARKTVEDYERSVDYDPR